MSQGAYTLDDVQQSPQQTGAYSLSDIQDSAAGTSDTSRSWLDSAKDFASGLWQQVNPVSGIKGAAQLTAHPIQTYMADASNRQQILDQAEKDFKAGNYGSGVAHSLYGIIPFLGPQMNEAGTNIGNGQVAKGLGQSIGLGLATAGPAAMKDTLALGTPQQMQDVARRWYQSALKPSTTTNPTKLAGAITGGLENGIPISKGGLAKLGDLIDDVNNKISQEIAKNPNQPISKFAVASRLGDTANQFATQVNPNADLDAVSQSGNEFLENQPNQIPAADAQAMKKGTYQQLKSKAYGELKGASIESQKALARGLKEELANAFPELNDLNAKDSQLINLDGMLERAVNRIGNHQIFGIGTPLAAAGTKALTGSNKMAAAAAFTKAILDDPYIKSKMAIALNRGSNGGITVPMALAKYQGYVDALGNVSTSPAPSDQGIQ